MYRWIKGIYGFDYMGHKKLWFAISACIILAGIASMLIRGGGNPIDGLKYGLEFRSGTRITVEFDKSPSLSDIRGIMDKQGLGDAVIQQTSGQGGVKAFQIQVGTLTPEKELAVKQALDKAFTISGAGAGYASESVGATFGKSVITASYKAVGLAFLLILLYITFRFEWKFALGALAAEIHDLLIVIGVYSLVGREVTTASIAAVLTILGYSLYDTVIIFDRIRENAPRMRGMPYGDMVDRSIWETLTRSINTTLTVLIPVLCLLLFGGATLKDFAFALLIGIVSGVYSSIFVASPIATLLKEREPENRKLIERAARAQG